MVDAALPKTLPEILSDISDFLEPFVRAWQALPEDVRQTPGRNLADVLGVFTSDDAPALTVADLGSAVMAYALVTPIPIDDLDAAMLAQALPAEDQPRTCRECGCTDFRACITGGVSCHWIEDDLCSACAPPGRRPPKGMPDVPLGAAS